MAEPTNNTPKKEEFEGLEEDDEFEEFEDDWVETQEDKTDATLWEDDWDDEDIEDDFSAQLRQELTKVQT
uniref:26S proteasome complex subunit DSS1 n=1 Tax=Arcella intermedia TaxID=1963864 RepID=A0A6B2LYR9_9EUKA